MLLKYGPFSLGDNSTDLQTSIQASLDDFGRPTSYVHTISAQGVLEADGQAACATAEAALRAALSVPYLDLVLYTDAGLATPTKLINSTSLSGVRVISLDFDNRRGGAEYATLRSWSAVFQAEYLFLPSLGAGEVLLSLSETVSVTGTGGPVLRWRPAINGPPVRQQVSPFSVVRATQSGTATGLLGYPTPALPLWPSAELFDERTVTRRSPERTGRGLSKFAVTWAYSFEANGPLVGLPVVPPPV